MSHLITSKPCIKVRNPPGGQSSISFGDWKEPSHSSTTPLSARSTSSRSSQDTTFEGYFERPKTGVKVNQIPGGNSTFTLSGEYSQTISDTSSISSSNTFYDSQPQPNQIKTTIKVQNPPGGRSSIIFG